MCDVIGRAASFWKPALLVNIEYARPVFIHDHPRIRGMLSGGRRLAYSIGFQPPRGSRRAAPLIPKRNGSIIVPSVFHRRPVAVRFSGGCLPLALSGSPRISLRLERIRSHRGKYLISVYSVVNVRRKFCLPLIGHGRGRKRNHFEKFFNFF